jgi:hypothetical protein
MSDETRLLGTINDNWVPGNGGYINNTNNAILSRWKTDTPGQVAYIWVKVSKAGEVKVALYADNNGVPGALLGRSAKATVKPGWNSIWLLYRVDIIMNRSYWIGFIGNVDTGMFYYGPLASGINLYRPAAYANWSWPSQAGTGWIPQNGNEYASKALGFPLKLVLGSWGDGNPSLDGGQNYVILSKQQANYMNEGLIYGILVHVSQPGMAKVAVYADNGGQPGALLGAVNTEQPVSTGWNLIRLPKWVKVINMKDYWIGFYGSVTSGMYCYSYLQGTGCHARWKLDTYSPNWQWPDPAGPGWTEQLDYSYSNGAVGFPVVKLLGTDLNSFGSGGAVGNVRLEQWRAIDSGVVTEIQVHSINSGTIKVALYKDTNGQPYALLSAVNDPQPVSPGWNIIALPKPAAVIGNNAYWIGVCVNCYLSAAITTTAVKHKFSQVDYNNWQWPDRGSNWPDITDFELGFRACGIAGLSGIETITPVLEELLTAPASAPPPIRKSRRQRKPNTRVRKPRQP